MFVGENNNQSVFLQHNLWRLCCQQICCKITEIFFTVYVWLSEPGTSLKTSEVQVLRYPIVKHVS